MMKKVRMYADGGSRGNPGPAASGAVLYELDAQGNEVREITTATKYLGKTTNNQAEYMSIIIGLLKAKEFGFNVLDVRLDSELAVKQLNGQYKVKNAEIAKRFLEIHNLLPSFKSVTFTHIRREFNKRADELVNQTIDAELTP